MHDVLRSAAQAHLKQDDFSNLAPAGVNLTLVKQLLNRQAEQVELQKATEYATGVTKLINTSQSIREKMVLELRSLRAKETGLTKLLKDITAAEDYARESSNPVPLLELMVGKCALQDSALQNLLSPKDLKQLSSIPKASRRK